MPAKGPVLTKHRIRINIGRGSAPEQQGGDDQQEWE